MREIIANGEIGELQRVVWVITNWYRSQSYYDSSNWRATWNGEGGGVGRAETDSSINVRTNLICCNG